MIKRKYVTEIGGNIIKTKKEKYIPSIHSGHRERMRKKLLQDTNDLLEPHELLEILLFYCIPRRNTNEIAHFLLKKFGSVSRIFEAPPKELEKVSNVGKKSICLFSALGELKRRIEKEKQKLKSISISKDFKENIRKIISKISKKGLYIVLVNNKGFVVLAKRIKTVDKRFIKDISHKNDIYGIEISGAIIIDYSEKPVDIPSLIELENMKYVEQCLGLGNVKLLEYFLTDGKTALGIKDKNSFSI